MKTAVAACMRNEGPFLMEWVAFQHVIGFDEVIVATNHCTDGSDTLLDLMADRGWLTHLRHDPAPGTAPQHTGMTAVFNHVRDRNIGLLLHCDSDEFLNIGLGKGRIPDLLSRAGEADVIALPWKTFGDNGHQGRTLPILPNFTACEDGPDQKTKFKSMFRPTVFTHANDHMPTGCQIDDPLVLSAAGHRLQTSELFADKRAKYRPFDKSIKPHAAVLNHYATRAADDFLMKNDRGDGQGKQSNKYHLNSHWHAKANRNEKRDTRILRHWPATEARLAEWRSDPEIAAAEQACLDWDTARRAAILTPENRAAWNRGAA